VISIHSVSSILQFRTHLFDCFSADYLLCEPFGRLLQLLSSKSLAPFLHGIEAVTKVT
jgi:hypothetical protein